MSKQQERRGGWDNVPACAHLAECTTHNNCTKFTTYEAELFIFVGLNAPEDE